MRLDGGLEISSARDEACQGDGADRGEEERWEVESETAEEVARTGGAEGALGLLARGDGGSAVPACGAARTDVAQEWMRTDFAEERRWKVVLSRELAYQVVQWYLSRADEKAEGMVGGRGWGQSKDVPIPGHSGVRLKRDMPHRLGSPEHDVEMIAGQPETEEHDLTAERGDGEDAMGAQVLEDILSTIADPGKNPAAEAELNVAGLKGKHADEDDDMGEDVDAEGEEDAEGEPDAGGEVNAVDESDSKDGPNAADDVDAGGEADAEAEGVVGLEGEHCR